MISRSAIAVAAVIAFSAAAASTQAFADIDVDVDGRAGVACVSPPSVPAASVSAAQSMP